MRGRRVVPQAGLSEAVECKGRSEGSAGSRTLDCKTCKSSRAREGLQGDRVVVCVSILM